MQCVQTAKFAILFLWILPKNLYLCPYSTLSDMNNETSIHYYPLPERSVVAFSTTRHGGCGTDAYESFNCTPYTGDEPAVVRANQEHLCNALGIAVGRLIIPYQTHGCDMLTVDEAFMSLSSDAKQAMLQEKDAVMTDVKDICICVSTADCIPIFLYDKAHEAIAIVHAGWRGTVQHIVSRVLHAMNSTYGTQCVDVDAVIGPGISFDAFEVGTEVFDAFRAEGFNMELISRWYPEKSKYHIDLPAVNRHELLSAGVPIGQICDSNICTFSQHRTFFSARRLGVKSGRILNGIMIRKNKLLI